MDMYEVVDKDIRGTKLALSIHVGIYAVASVLLVAVELLISGEENNGRLRWSPWALTGWGAGVAIHALVSKGVVTALRDVERRAVPPPQQPIVIADNGDD